MEDLRFVLGVPGREALKELNVTDLDRVHSKWSETVLEFSHEVSVFPDIENVLKSLSESSVKTGIVTSKNKTGDDR